MTEQKEKIIDDRAGAISEQTAALEEPITAKDRLNFAKCILGVLALLFLLGGISELIRPGLGIFEACKNILPAIATLVIGYYFGKSN